MERLTKEAELRKQYAIADGTYNEKVFEKKQNYDLQFTDPATGRSDSYGGALEYKDGKYIIHDNFLCCYILDVYYKQFFYHFDLFVEKLEETFGMEVNHIDNVISVNIVNPEMDKETKEELLNLVQNTDFLNHYMEDVYTDIRKTPVFDESYYLKELGLPFKDAIEKVCTLSERQLTQLTNELTQKYMSQLDSYQLEFLEDILTRKKLFNDLKGYNKDVIGKVLRNENYIEKLKKMLKIGIPLNTSIRISVKDISKRIREYQIIENNKKYLQNPSDLLTTARQTQYWILHYIETELHFDMKGKNRILMNDDRVKQICNLIETNTKVSYKPKQGWNMIMMMFRSWCITKNGQKQILLSELNTTFNSF